MGVGDTGTRVVVVGQGYVGLPLAMRAVAVGLDVMGLEIDRLRVSRLLAGDSYVEDVSSDELRSAIESGRYCATSEVDDIKGFDVAVITVPTPLRHTLPDLSHIEAAARAVARGLTRGALVILESTTYPGTTEEVLVPILEEESGLAIGTDVLVGYSPERIDPGNDEWDLINTPKVTSGINAASLEAVNAFYRQLVDTTVPVSSPKEAELTKLLENTFRHVNIALVNELAVFADELGIDVWEAIDAASTKPFGYMRFTPGPGVGGHCLPVDPSYLSWHVRRSLGESFRFVELANDVNAHMPDYVVDRLGRAMNKAGRAMRGTKVLLLGVGYKRNTGDARESPALAIAEKLNAVGALVRASDPYANDSTWPPNTERVDFSAAELAASDAVLMLTNHDAFDVVTVTKHAKYVLDCRRVVPDGENVEYLQGGGEDVIGGTEVLRGRVLSQADNVCRMLRGDEWFFPQWRSLIAPVLSAPGVVLDIGTPARFNKELAYVSDAIVGSYFAVDLRESDAIDVLALGEELPIRSGSVSGVVCSHVLEHVREPQRVVDECLRVLVSGGRAYFTLLDTWPAHGSPGWYEDFHRFKADAVALLFQDWGNVEVVVGGGAVQVLVNYVPGRFRRMVQRLANVFDQRHATTITPIRFVVATK